MGFTDMRINNKTSRQKNKNKYMRDETLQTWQERWLQDHASAGKTRRRLIENVINDPQNIMDH